MKSSNARKKRASRPEGASFSGADGPSLPEASLSRTPDEVMEMVVEQLVRERARELTIERGCREEEAVEIRRQAEAEVLSRLNDLT